MLAMTCRELADFLMEYLDGELPTDVRAAFDRHLSLCPNCVAYVAAYKTTIAMGRRAFAENEDEADAGASTNVPDDLVKAILAARERHRCS